MKILGKILLVILIAGTILSVVAVCLVRFNVQSGAPDETDPPGISDETDPPGETEPPADSDETDPPVVPEEFEEIVNFENRDFVIRNVFGESYVSEDVYASRYITTVSGSSMTSAGTDLNGDDDYNACSYFTKLYPITQDSYYTLYVNAKNARVGGYSGVVFASDASDKPYFVYGAINNGRDNATGECDLRLRYGYHSHNGKIDGLITEPRFVQDLDSDGYGQYKIVYDGLTVTVYTMSRGEWTAVYFGGNSSSFTLPEGCSVAVGVYNRHGYGETSQSEGALANGQRTTNICGVRIVVKEDVVELPEASDEAELPVGSVTD